MTVADRKPWDAPEAGDVVVTRTPSGEPDAEDPRMRYIGDGVYEPQEGSSWVRYRPTWAAWCSAGAIEYWRNGTDLLAVAG